MASGCGSSRRIRSWVSGSLLLVRLVFDVTDCSDGLHLTAEGYEPIFNALTKVILDKWPEMNPEIMNMPTPQYVILRNLC
jgi:lysophospholipase L1-like esterase